MLNTIVSLLTFGIVLWFVGLEEDLKWFKISGASLVALSVILNMIDCFG